MDLLLFSSVSFLFISLVNIFIGVLGFVVFFNNRKSITNKSFLVFCLVTLVWGFFTFFVSNVTTEHAALWVSRGVMFSAVWQAFAIFQLFYVFPEENFLYKKSYKYVLLPIVCLISLMTLSPLVFSKVIRISIGSAPVLEKSSGMIAFGFLSVSLVVLGLYSFLKKIIKAPKDKKKPFLLILLGAFVAFACIIFFNFILSAFFNNESFIPFGALFMLPFALFTSYSIAKNNLFNVKLISTEVVGFFLVVFNLFELVAAKSSLEVILRISISAVLFIFTILLIQSVHREIDQKEKVAKLAQSLETANLRLQELDKQKTEFLSIASHQLRTPLSILKGYIELIKDGAYGKVNAKTKTILDNMDESNERLVKLVDEFLDISRIEQGRTKFVFEKKDMDTLIDSVVKELDQRAKDKGLKISWKHGKDKMELCMDEDKVRHVVFNFIDNAIKYSEKGVIKVFIEKDKKDGKIVIEKAGSM